MSARGVLPSWLVRAAALYRAGETWVLDRQHARYGTSLARILFGLVAWLTVLTNLADRQAIWGSASRWQDPLRQGSPWGAPFTLFNPEDPGWLLDLKLVLPAAAGLLLMLGWRTRIMAIVTLFLMISLVQSAPTSLDQGDNAYRILLFFFCFTDMSHHWSLDARRRRRRVLAGKGGYRFLPAPDWLLNTLHNLGLVAISAQLFFIYVGAGLAKVQGSKWQHGTAIYYPLHVAKFDVWPALSNLVTGPGLLVGLVTYFAVFIQIFFPLLLLRRWTRIIALLGIGGMHLGIAVLMGLPLFSLTMVAADVIFITDRSYARAQEWLASRWPGSRPAGPARGKRRHDASLTSR